LISNMFSPGRRSFLTLTSLASVVVLGSALARAQGISVSSSLDQTATITSRGSHATANPAGPIALPEAFSHLVLAPGFTVQLTVFDAPEMDETLAVDPSGNLAVPLVGLVQVADDDLRTAERKIRAALIDKQELVDPQVTLVITAYPQTPVVVAGEVQQPGKFPILAPQPVLDLIAAAGGVTTAAGGEIEIDHRGPEGTNEVRRIPFANGQPPEEAHQTLVYPGDTVFVRRAGVVYVLGAVNRPGGYLMVNGTSLTVPQAVALASGTLPVAVTSHAVVVRKGPNGPQQIQVALRAQDKGEQSAFVLQSGDMLYVPTSTIKSVLYNSSAILSSAASAAIYTADR
jgi:polysaccharide export outer membrane protein